MVKHPASRRVPRKEDEVTDPVIARMVQFGEWAKQNARIVIGAAIALAVVVVAVMYYVQRQAQLEELAAVRLGEVRQTAASGNVQLAIRDLSGFVDRFGGTRAADEGTVLLGQLYIQAAQPAQAISLLETFEAEDPLLDATAGLLLAAAYEESGNLRQAEQAYLAVAEGAEYEFQRREGLEDAARVRMELGDAAGAAELYERLVGMMDAEEEAAQRGVYELRLAEARAEAAHRSTAAAARDTAS